MSNNNDNFANRPHLDGLRGIAVLQVVLYHAELLFFKGGFNGVPVFFVLSGFLITGKMWVEYQKTGSIHFGKFFAKRTRRLLPPAMIVLAVSGIALVMTTDVYYYGDFMMSYAAASAYGANWYFLHTATDYFASSQPPSPVLHFWSLAIEEQFYLVWPFVCGWCLFKTRVRMWVLGGIVAAGALWTWHLGMVNPMRAHFGTDARVYQLLAGAMIALGAVKPLQPHRAWIGRLVSMIGLLAVLLLSTSLIDVPPYQRGMLTVIATAILIVGSEMIGAENQRGLLAWRPLRHLGELSYGIYLWHWPIGLLGTHHRLLPETGTWGYALTVFILSVACAQVSLWVLEYPLRKHVDIRQPLIRRWTVGLGLAASALLALLVMRFDAHLAKDPVLVQAAASPVNPEKGTLHHLIKGSEDAPRVLLAGDSTMAMWWLAMEDVAVERDWDLDIIWAPWCLWVYRGQAWTLQGFAAMCSDVGETLDQASISGQYDLVILAGHVFSEASYTSDGKVFEPGSAQWKQQLLEDGEAIVAGLNQAGTDVILVEPIPRFRDRPRTCLRGLDDAYCDKRPDMSEEAVMVRDVWREIARRHSDHVQTVNLNDIMCPQGVCAYVQDGIRTRRDKSHVTPEYVQLVSPDIGKQICWDGAFTSQEVGHCL